MLRTVVEARTLVAMMVAACVGTWGLRAHPVDQENLFLALIAAKDPTVFHVLTYGYATLWFSTPFFAASVALSTLAIVAYFGPCTRPDIARIRGVAADSVVAGLVERGLIAEAGRDAEAAGAIRYKTTPLFERVFGLESLAALPRLDDLGGEADVIRERLEAVAEKRPA